MLPLTNWFRQVRKLFSQPENRKPAKKPSFALQALEDRTVPAADLFSPVYSVAFSDATTSDNEFVNKKGVRYWTVDQGADNYQIDLYERPTSGDYALITGADGVKRYAADKYYSNLDIVEGKAGFDSNYLYVSLRVAGQEVSHGKAADNERGLAFQYGFRLSNNAEGSEGQLIYVDAPKNKKAPTKFNGDNAFILQDGNGDVGGSGLSVTREDNSWERTGDGYEDSLVKNGSTKRKVEVLWTRINPNDENVIEFVVNYRYLGYTEGNLKSLPFFDFQADRGIQDARAMSWNDQFTKRDAGSPYGNSKGNGKSEFGTDGLGSISSVDTLRGGPISTQPDNDPKPGTASLSGFVYLDQDDNGFFDNSDSGLGGVTLTLTGTDDHGNAVNMTAVTDGNGFYSFNGLKAGKYSITQTQPGNYADSSDSLGTLGGNSDNDTFYEIVVADGQHGTDYDFAEIEFGGA